MNTNNRTYWISRTAVLTALLLILQFSTKALGQIVTGSCVNAVLTVAALSAGWWCAFTVALLSPLLAFMLGIGPAFIQLVPAIALGNLALVGVFCLPGRRLPQIPALLLAAAAKFLLLYVSVILLLLPLLSLPAPKAEMISAMFSWPQLITALIGGLLGSYIARLINPVIKGRKNTTAEEP